MMPKRNSLRRAKLSSQSLVCEGFTSDGSVETERVFVSTRASHNRLLLVETYRREPELHLTPTECFLVMQYSGRFLLLREMEDE